MRDIYEHQKRGHVLMPPKLLSQVEILQSSKTNKISSHKQNFPQDNSPIRKQNRRERDVFSSPVQSTAKKSTNGFLL
jgi:hypothetical protein